MAPQMVAITGAVPDLIQESGLISVSHVGLEEGRQSAWANFGCFSDTIAGSRIGSGASGTKLVLLSLLLISSKANYY